MDAAYPAVARIQEVKEIAFCGNGDTVAAIKAVLWMTFRSLFL